MNNYLKTSSTINLLKYLAILSMIIDHIGYIFYPDIDELRYIGRFAFIAFAFILTHNYLFISKNKDSYKNNLLVFGLISLVPHYLAFNHLELNVMYTLLLGLLLIDSYKNKIYFEFFIILCLTPFVEYGLFGVLLIFFFFKFLQTEKTLFIIPIFLSAIIMNMNIFMIPAVIISLIIVISLNINFKIPRLPGWLFYWFYPIHLFLLFTVYSHI